MKNRRNKVRLAGALVALTAAPLAKAADDPKEDSSYPTAEIGLDIRIDAEVSEMDWDHETEKKKDSFTERFVFASSRVNIRGKLDEDTSYRIRYQAKSDHTNAGADHLTNAIQYFYLDHWITDNVRLRFGKQFVVTSSWEFNYDRSKAYHYSQTFLESPAYYETGAQLGYSFLGQFVGIQATNSIPEAAEKRGKDLTKGLFYYGNVADGLLEPIASYVVFPKPRDEVGDKKDDKASTVQWAAGTKVTVSPADFYVIFGGVKTPEYDHYVEAEDTTPLQVTEKSEGWQTAILYGRYKFEDPDVHPFVKLSYDRGRWDGEPYQTFMRSSTGVEYFPTSERFWLHATYVEMDDKFREVKRDGMVAKAENRRRTTKYLVGVGSDF